MLRNIIAGLIPRVVRQMTDHPGIPHGIARCRYLWMHIAARQLSPAVMRDLKGIITDEAGAKALRTIKFIGIDLRLRMVMRNIA